MKKKKSKEKEVKLCEFELGTKLELNRGECPVHDYVASSLIINIEFSFQCGCPGTPYHQPSSARVGDHAGVRRHVPRVHKNRWEPVRFDRLPVKSVRTGSGQTGSNSKFKFEFKKMKNS